MYTYVRLVRNSKGEVIKIEDMYGNQETLAPNRKPKSRGFQWLSHSGSVHDLDDMATSHIFYALRMIFNHKVPKKYQTPPNNATERANGIKRYSDVPFWSNAYCTKAMKALRTELNRRPKSELPVGADVQLKWMDLAAEALGRDA